MASAVVTGAYVAAFLTLAPVLGLTVGALVIIPLAVIAWVGGLWVGIVAAVLAFPLNTLLANFAGHTGLDAIVRAGGGLPLALLPIIGAAIGRLSDNGQRIRAQQRQLLAAADELRATGREHEMAIAASNSSIWNMDLRRSTAYRRPTWFETLGYDPADAANRDSSSLLADPLDVGRVAEVIRKYLDRQIPEYRVEFAMRTKERGIRWFQSRGRATWDADGVPVRLMGSTVDITERKQSEERLRALFEVSHAVSLSHGVEHVLQVAVDAVRKVTGAAFAEIRVARTGQHVRGTSPTVTKALALETERFAAERGYPEQVLRSAEPLVLEATQAGVVFPASLLNAGINVFLSVPLRGTAGVLGVLGAACHWPQGMLDRADMQMWEGLAEIIGTAIERSQLHEQVERQAIQEDRIRIAQDLHDGSAQILGYISTQASAIRALMDEGQIDRAREEFTAIQAAARELAEDVQIEIMGLRSAADPGSFAMKLPALIEDLVGADGLNVNLHGAEAVDRVALDPMGELQLIWIVQEALRNVQKHASATHVDVRIEASDGRLKVSVIDDGVGFRSEDALDRNARRFGLQTMQERAANVEGEVSITSRPGAGTSVEISLPATTVETGNHEPA